jgi:hypothetical protein
MENTIKQAVSTDKNIISELEDKIVLLEDEKTLLENEKAELLAKLYWYEENFRLEQHRRYGRSSEQTIPGQQSLFNEAEALDALKTDVPEPTVEEITYKRKKKQKGHREEMLKDLPVEIVEHKLPEEEQICDVCGKDMHEMSVEITSW